MTFLTCPTHWPPGSGMIMPGKICPHLNIANCRWWTLSNRIRMPVCILRGIRWLLCASDAAPSHQHPAPFLLLARRKVRIAPLSLVNQEGDTTRDVTVLPGLSGQPDPIRNMIIIDHFFRGNPPPDKSIGNAM